MVAQPIGWVVAWVLVLILVAMITQAFERQAVMVLQGDWTTRGPVGGLGRWRIRRHLGRRDRVSSELTAVNDVLVEQVSKRLAGLGFTWPKSAFSDDQRLQAVELLVRWGDLTQIPEELEDEARSIPWTRCCEPHLMALRDNLQKRLERYPREAWSFLPTRLGNLLAYRYEQLDDEGVNSLDFVIVNFDRISSRLRRNHDVSRGRLDMYCTLVFTFVGLAGLAPVMLLVPGSRSPASNGDPMAEGTAVLSAVYLGLAWLSNEAALRAADFYSRTLESARRYLSASGGHI
jgi:hypothetical protein